MAAYLQVYDTRHLQADCQEPGSALEPYDWQSSMVYLYLFSRCVCCSLCTTLCLQWEPEIIAVAVMYLTSRLTKFDITDWQGKPSGYRGKWYDFIVEDVTLELLEGGFD